jgi:small-conductance mechanosensitive channel
MGNILFPNTRFYGNSIDDWVIALLIFLVILASLRILKEILYRRVKAMGGDKTAEWQCLLENLICRIRLLFFLFIAVYAASQWLSLPEVVTTVFYKLLKVALLLQGALLVSEVISCLTDLHRKKKMIIDAESATSIIALGFVTRITLWIIIILLILDNLGISITPLIAGLGITGIAVALAVQNILGDLFASLSIILDKPFVIGDFIIVDKYMGTIEHIGLKTTRMRSLSGEQLVFPNNDLLQSRIRNYKRMNERRIVFSIGVVYQTPHEKLEMMPRLIREVIEKQKNTRFDRAHFSEFGPSSLNFEVVYRVLSPDYNLYMDIQQAINLELFHRFAHEGIEFAYPTQTLYINRESDLAASLE